MTLHLTPEMLEKSYDLLRVSPPFRRYSLPPSEEITFHVGRTRHLQGEYDHVRDVGHVITISDGKIGRLVSLIEVMAHEMIHLYQREKKSETPAQHNVEFRRLAKIVCRHHGFDPKLF